MPIMMLVIYGSIIAIMWFGGHMVDSGTLEIGLLTTFFTYVGQILVSLMMVSMIFMMLTRVWPAGAALWKCWTKRRTSTTIIAIPLRV